MAWLTFSDYTAENNRKSKVKISCMFFCLSTNQNKLSELSNTTIYFNKMQIYLNKMQMYI